MISPRSSPRLIRRSMTPTNVIPPPLPPRKSSPTLEQTIPTTSSITMRNGTSSTNGTVTSCNTVEEPKIVLHQLPLLPRIMKSSSMQEINRDTSSSETDNVVELSSPETIYGIVISDFNMDTKSYSKQSQYWKSPQPSPCPTKSSTTPNFGNAQINIIKNISHEPTYENIRINMPPRSKEKYNPLTSDDNSSVCYENLNMDYIKKLVSEGYSRDSVIKALGITRNNVDMACDILHEFGTKLG